MSKKVNTVLFIAAATVFNIVTFLAIFFGLFFLVLAFSDQLLANEGTSSLLTPLFVVLFLSAIFLSFVIYRLVLGFFLRKVDPDEHFTLLFEKEKDAVVQMPHSRGERSRDREERTGDRSERSSERS